MAKCLISYYGITNETCWYPSKIESAEADVQDTLGNKIVNQGSKLVFVVFLQVFATDSQFTQKLSFHRCIKKPQKTGCRFKYTFLNFLSSLKASISRFLNHLQKDLACTFPSVSALQCQIKISFWNNLYLVWMIFRSALNWGSLEVFHHWSKRPIWMWRCCPFALRIFDSKMPT